MPAFVAVLGCGLAVADAHFDLPQQSYDLFWFLPLDDYDRLLPRWILSFHLVQKALVTSTANVLS
jgi:hypothetical protein